MRDSGQPAAPADGFPPVLPVDAVPGLVWRADAGGRWLVNRCWREFTGRAAADRAAWCAAVHPDDLGRCIAGHRAVLGSAATRTVEYRLVRHDGQWRRIVERLAATVDGRGAVAGLVGCGMDVEERMEEHGALRRALEERNALVAELQHRVRNTVQMIASMLTFQARRADGAEAARLLGRSARRVRAMGLAQERLLARPGPAERVDLAAYLVGLAGELIRAGDAEIRLEAETEPVAVLAGTAAPLGLIVSELVLNALQHAFPAGGSGAIRLELRRRGSLAELVVGDDGAGLPPGVWPLSARGEPRVGMTMLAGLSRQARARIVLEEAPGTRFRISFPLR